MGKKELVIVTGDLGSGGAERVLSELSMKWSENYDITFWCLERQKCRINYQLPTNIQILDSQVSITTPFFRIRYSIELTKYLQKHSEAIVIAFVKRAIFVVALCRPFIRNKIIFSERCDPRYSPTSQTRRIIRNFIYHAADAYVFQAEDDKNYFPNNIQARSKVIPNPVNPNLPKRCNEKERKTIITACRLSAQKNLTMLIDAFTLLTRDYPEYTLEIYGQGEEKDRLQNQIHLLFMDEKISLKGFVKDIYTIMNQCSIYVCSSNYEGISNSLLEAMALGMPVISTDCSGGTRMLVQDGVNGLLVPVGATESMYLAMKRVIEEPGLAERLGNEAYKVRERFAIEKIAREWLDVIEEGES